MLRSSLCIKAGIDRHRMQITNLRENPDRLIEFAQKIEVDPEALTRIVNSQGHPGEFDDLPLGVIGRVLDGLSAGCGFGFLLDIDPKARDAFRLETGLDQKPPRRKKPKVVDRKPLTLEEEVVQLKGQIKEIELKTGMRLQSHCAAD